MEPLIGWLPILKIFPPPPPNGTIHPALAGFVQSDVMIGALDRYQAFGRL